MAHGEKEVIFTDIFLVTEESTLFFIFNSYTTYNLQKRSNVWKSTHWLDFSVWNIFGTKSMTQSIDSRG